MEKNLEISVLLDYYGQMLTEKQLEVAQLYYNEDLSLAEIAQFANITRQGVRDSIKRAEATLLEMEERMGLARSSGIIRRRSTRLPTAPRRSPSRRKSMPWANESEKKPERFWSLHRK